VEQYSGIRSSEIEKAMELISEIIKKNEKVIVMVKWVELLNLIAERCDQLMISYLRIEGN
jgi:SNF2 family DNA or RNA helicase